MTQNAAAPMNAATLATWCDSASLEDMRALADATRRLAYPTHPTDGPVSNADAEAAWMYLCDRMTDRVLSR